MSLGVIRAEASPYRMPLDQIGGGRVIRGFRKAGEYVRVGTYLTAEEILDINPTNRTSLIGHFIDVWPKSPDRRISPPPRPAATAEQAERHVVSLGFNKFLVIEGTKLTEEPVSRSEAYALAGRPEPKKRGAKEH